MSKKERYIMPLEEKMNKWFTWYGERLDRLEKKLERIIDCCAYTIPKWGTNFYQNKMYAKEEGGG